MSFLLCGTSWVQSRFVYHGMMNTLPCFAGKSTKPVAFQGRSRITRCTPREAVMNGGTSTGIPTVAHACSLPKLVLQRLDLPLELDRSRLFELLQILHLPTQRREFRSVRTR